VVYPKLKKNQNRTSRAETMTETILRSKDVVAALGVSRSTLYRMMNSGEFPKSLKISRNTVGWRKSVVEQWVTQRPLSS
jgi:prophage regulatory protein